MGVSRSKVSPQVGPSQTSLNIEDLVNILEELNRRHVSKDKWHDFGLKLGLYQPTLAAIEANHRGDVERCFKECLTAWLNRADGVNEPTWLKIADALQEINRTTADNIRDKFSPAKSIPTTETDHVEYLPDDLRDTFIKMNGRFAALLNGVVKEIRKSHSLEDVKEYLILFEARASNELNKIENDRQFKEYLRQHCHLSNFGLLVVLVDYFNLTSCKNDIEQFIKERNERYEAIKATEFAKQAIKDHEISSERKLMTFTVSWSLQQTTLREFEEFLNKCFHQYRIHISLQSAHHSLLTFVCTIPNWIVDELVVFTENYTHGLYLEGVVQITIDDHVITIVNEFNLISMSLFNEVKNIKPLIPLTLLIIAILVRIFIAASPNLLIEAIINQLVITYTSIMTVVVLIVLMGISCMLYQGNNIRDKAIVGNQKDIVSLNKEIDLLKQNSIKAKIANDKEVEKLNSEIKLQNQHLAIFETEKQVTNKEKAFESNSEDVGDTNEHTNTLEQSPESRQHELPEMKDKMSRAMLQEIDTLRNDHAGLKTTLEKKEGEVEALRHKVSSLSVQLLGARNRNPHSKTIATLHDDWREDHTPPVQVVMTSFSSYRKTNEHWYSPSFLSHEKGYRMCLKVKANGEDEVKGTHLSVRVHLMMGDNDDTLSWPFIGLVKVELINRRFNGRNHERKITFSDTSDQEARRVFNGIPLQTGMASFMGHGGIKFIRQNDLTFNPQTGTEYLKDDSIKLKVTSVISIKTTTSIPAAVPIPDAPLLKTNVPLPVIEFQIDKFSTRKAYNEECISKPFYSHPSDKGYKFVLFVYPNGRGEYKGKSVSVFVHLMKGENDSELDFPFRGELLVQIVNHSNKNHGHVEKPITFSKETDPNGKYGAQVAGITTWFSSGRSFEGYGFPNFLSHDFLKFSTDRNTQYVSDDDILLMRVVKITTQ